MFDPRDGDRREHQFMGPFQFRHFRLRSRDPSDFSTTTMSSHSALFVPSHVGETRRPPGTPHGGVFSTQAWKSVADIQTWCRAGRHVPKQFGFLQFHGRATELRKPRSTLQRAPVTRPPIGTPCRCIQTELPNVANGWDRQRRSSATIRVSGQQVQFSRVT